MKSGVSTRKGNQPRQGLNSVAAFPKRRFREGLGSWAVSHCCGWSSTQPRSVERRSATVLKASGRYQRKKVSFLLQRNRSSGELLPSAANCFSLSPRERAGVRGKSDG